MRPDVRAFARGLIPARAGNTPKYGSPVHMHRAHPRSRGEHENYHSRRYRVQGSSPLARGTLRHLSRRGMVYGLIPARAGNTKISKSMEGKKGAHPRSRGEHHISVSSRCRFGGSSPLARGTLRAAREAAGVLGLIPARAGNTPVNAVVIAAYGAHPRSRGEHLYHYCRRCRHGGSSPLARGTRAPDRLAELRDGLIPARAGNTVEWVPAFCAVGAHPRSRGEHRPAAASARSFTGSSPLARGTREGREGLGLRVGLIPARAGNTRRKPHTAAPPGAHPRSRGEHAAQPGANDAPPGSSPLARGTPGLQRLRHVCRGLIPARAGNT